MKRLLLALSLISLPVFARDLRPQFVEPQEEAFVHVRTARIVHLDYDLLKADFEELRDKSNQEIDTLILEQLAYVSQAQATRVHQFNTPIETDGELKNGIRPATYGRAAIFKFLNGWIDIKGCGMSIFTTPAMGTSSRYGKSETRNGLFEVSEGIREFVYENLVRDILKRGAYAPGTVQSYGVIDYGFDMTGLDGQVVPAGGILRRATARDPQNPAGFTPAEKSSKIEAVLMRSGVTSKYSLATTEWPLLSSNNVQTDSQGRVFDFGEFLAFTQLRNAPVKAEEATRVEFAKWGYKYEAAPWRDNLRLWGQKIAQQFRAHEVSPEQINGKIKEWLDPKVSACEMNLN